MNCLTCERCGSAMVYDAGTYVCPGCGARMTLDAYGDEQWTAGE